MAHSYDCGPGSEAFILDEARFLKVGLKIRVVMDQVLYRLRSERYRLMWADNEHQAHPLDAFDTTSDVDIDLAIEGVPVLGERRVPVFGTVPAEVGSGWPWCEGFTLRGVDVAYDLLWPAPLYGPPISISQIGVRDTVTFPIQRMEAHKANMIRQLELVAVPDWDKEREFFNSRKSESDQ